ncbi:MAG: hypothetical protein Fur0021_29360 [Candidatus Promineifilaceae bacterium]
MRRFLFPLMLILLVLACGQASPAPTAVPPSTTPVPATVTPDAGSSFPFTIALEYGILGVAEAYAATGVTYIKPQLVYSLWGNVEPEPGRFVWGPLDAAIQEYQAAGFTGVQLLLSTDSPWAASRRPRLGDLGNTFPQEQYLDDYVAFVTKAVERYDGDGAEDMPGLLYGIHHYGVEREFTGFWPGPAEDYVRLLRLAYAAIKAADEQAEVLLVGLLMGDVFDGNPDKAEIAQRLGETPSFRKSAADIQMILAACDAYDMVDFHSLGDYSEIPATAAWIWAQLAANGCGEKPIWIGDAFPMSGLFGFGGFVPPIPFWPVTAETVDAAVAWIQAAADAADAGHEAALARLQAETARGLVKKIVVSAAAGLRGINVGNLEDWKTGVAAVDRAAVPALGASMFMGLMDTTLTGQQPGGALPYSGQAWATARRAGVARPAFYALALTVEMLEGFTGVTPLDLGAGVWAFRFERPQGPAWVLWYDVGGLTFPEAPAVTTAVALPFAADQAVITQTPTVGKTAGQQVAASSGGMLTVMVDHTPVFVTEAP